MKSFASWLNDRTGVGDGWRWLADAPTPGRSGWRGVLPCVAAFLFCVQAMTGFCLWTFYSPSAQTAWESVYYVQHEVAGGWLLRGIHHYSAHVLLAVLLLAVLQSILTRAYRVPREWVFWATAGLGLFALAAILTGDLLAWDQNGYAATKTRVGFLQLLPWVGGDLLKLAIGGPGPDLGHLALTRFFALHVGVFAAGFLTLLILRGVWARRAGATEVAGGGQATPLWPATAWRGAAACLIAVGVVLVLSVQVRGPGAGAPLLSPADPTNTYDAARPEWFLMGMYRFVRLFPENMGLIPIFVVPGLLACVVAIMPFVGKYRWGHRLNVTLAVLLLARAAATTYFAYVKDYGDAKHQRAVAVERWHARRVGELIRHNGGIPPTGALSLLRTDPAVEGRRLFLRQCASCHNHQAPDAGAGIGNDIFFEGSTGPNLFQFASRRWIAGLLNPKRINGPDYFAGTKFRGGKMAGFVRETLGDIDAETIAKVVAALSAEAKLPAQRAVDHRDAKAIAEGRALIRDQLGCIQCHRFHGKGPRGKAPELDGYGSAKWVTGITANAGDVCFYGSRNDRMPAYAASTDPSQNTLSAEQIKLLAQWLRGEWYEEGGRGTGDWGRGI
jgi:ubiquinol-cytochrome c reductase cytochrome b subunit